MREREDRDERLPQGRDQRLTVQLRFVSRELAALDELDVEVLVASVFTDVRPARGVAALCDWRLGGRLSRLMREDFITGALGEVVMVPGKPKLAFDKIIVFGLGAKADFDKAAYATVIERVFTTLSQLRVRTAVVELPGRAEGLIDPIVAADVVLDEAERDADIDAWTLVEGLDARAAIEQHAAERRRRRRVLGE